MAEKTRYTDTELEEFRDLITEKLEKAQKEYEALRHHHALGSDHCMPWGYRCWLDSQTQDFRTSPQPGLRCRRLLRRWNVCSLARNAGETRVFEGCHLLGCRCLLGAMWLLLHRWHCGCIPTGSPRPCRSHSTYPLTHNPVISRNHGSVTRNEIGAPTQNSSVRGIPRH